MFYILCLISLKEENGVWGKLQLSRDEELVEKGKLVQLQVNFFFFLSFSKRTWKSRSVSSLCFSVFFCMSERCVPVCVRACVFVGQNKESIEKGGGSVTTDL